MNTANMPNYMANLQRQGVSPAERSRMAQVLGNCAQPLTHRGGMNVQGATHFTNNGSSVAGDTIYNGGSTANYKNGDITTNFNDNTSVNQNFVDNTFSQEFYDQRQLTTNNDYSQRTWNTHEYGDIINTVEMYSQLYENIYNEGNVSNQYNDNRMWDMRDFSQTTNNTFHQHIQEGDTFSFPTTNEFHEEHFFNGPTIINEGDVINKRLVINEGDTIINQGDTTITHEGDSYEQHFTNTGDVINNTFNNRNTYVQNRYTTEENHFHQQVNQFITEYIYSPKFINTFITILQGGPLLPFLQVGPFMKCNSLNVDTIVNTTAALQIPTVTGAVAAGGSISIPPSNLQGLVDGDTDCPVSVSFPGGTFNVLGQSAASTGNTAATVNLRIPINAAVSGVSCGMISGVGLTQGQGALPQ